MVHLNLAPVPMLPLLRAFLLAAAAKAGGSLVLLQAHTGRIPQVAETSPAFRWMMRSVLRLVDLFIVVSRPTYDFVKGLSNKVRLVPNGIRVDVNRLSELASVGARITE